MRSRPASHPAHPPANDLACVALRATAWADPVDVASAFADERHACVLLSGAEGWSYVLRSPDAVVDADDDLDSLLGAGEVLPEGPPFQGGVVGLAAYEFSARLEATAPQARGDWPDLTLLRYPALLAFHADARRALAVGREATLEPRRRRPTSP